MTTSRPSVPHGTFALLLALAAVCALLPAPAARAQSGCASTLRFDTPGLRFEQYVPGVGAQPLAFQGTRTFGNGSTLNTGPTYGDPTVYPNIQHDTTRDTILMHPGTFVTLSKAVSIAYPVDRTGHFLVTGDFARANNYVCAGNGVVVKIFVNADDDHPLFSSSIGACVGVDANNVFSGGGVRHFRIETELAAGDVLRFVVFNAGDGTFDVTALRASIDALQVSLAGPPSGTVVPVNTPVTFSGAIEDSAGDVHTAGWSFSSGSLQLLADGVLGAPAATSPGIESTPVSAAVTFTQAGVYHVMLTAHDQGCAEDSADTIDPDGLEALVVVYDPSGGYVNGGGWIVSPPGAFAADASLAGKASFGFVSKYERGATVPTGNTEFKFRLASLDFRSTAYEWLVIAGAKAQYKGWGTVNGEAGYRFMLTGWDGQRPGGEGADGFRIRIWNDATGGVVYDNVMGASETGDSTTALGGGSITIHRD